MSEIQRVVDELRFILQREAIENNDELTNLVAEYSQHCHAANVRLRQCDDCVKQGLRSEALHLAEAKPNLLDVVAVLDFAEREELLDLIGMCFLDSPEPLLLDVAAALNEAYAEHAPLQTLLDLHRLLALGRVPLSQRLTVLRSLADLDAASPHWEIDVRDMERARFPELDAESLLAVKSGNTAVLKSLVSEVQANRWREPIPVALTRNLKSRANQAIRTSAHLRMEQLSNELYNAFSALDAATARPLRDEWNQKRQIVQADENDPLCVQVAPVLEWLDDEDRKLVDDRAFSKNIAEIEQVLDRDDTTSADLKRFKLTADRLERALPSALESRFRSRLNALEILESRRRKLKLGAAVGAFAIITGLLGFMVHLSMEGEKSRRVISAITGFVEEGKLSEAQKLISQHGAKSTTEAWLAVKKRLSDGEQMERDRVANWQAEIATVRHSTEPLRVEAALKEARHLSKTAEEKIEVGELQSSWQKRLNVELAEREKAFRAAIASASISLKSLDELLSSGESPGMEQLQSLVGKAESEVSQLIPLRQSVARELSSQATLLDSRLNASRQAIANIARKEKLLDKITEAILILPGTSDTVAKQGHYEATVREYLTALPDDPNATIFKSAVENSLLPAILARQQLIDRWRRLRPIDGNDAETRIRDIRTLLTEFPQTPDRELLVQYETWLVSIARRFSDNGDPDEGIRQRGIALFSSKFIKDSHVITDVDGNQYYLSKPETSLIGNPASIVYLAGFNGETGQTTKRPEQLLSTKPSAPPQQEIAAKARTKLRDVTIAGWPDCFLEIAEMLLKPDAMDPFLRYLLVLKTVEFAGRGDSILEAELSSIIEKLNDHEIDRSVSWMDPKSSTAKAARERAGELLKELNPLKPIFEAAAHRHGQLEQDLFAVRFSVGWLDKTSRGDWICRTKWKPNDTHILQVASRPDANGMRSWSVLGSIKNDSITINLDVAQSVGTASVVFATRATDATKTASVQLK